MCQFDFYKVGYIMRKENKRYLGSEQNNHFITITNTNLT